MAHVILFKHQYLFGAHKHVFESNPSLYRATQGDDPDMNDQTSSLVVLEGDWEFFADPNFENQLGGTLGPGVYSSITVALGDGSNDTITSLRPVDSLAVKSKRGNVDLDEQTITVETPKTPKARKSKA